MKTERKIDNDCEKATFLIEKKQVDFISTLNTAELEVHLADCTDCRIFKKQSELINEACSQVLSQQTYKPSKLGRNFKNAMQNQIDSLLGKV